MFSIPRRSRFFPGLSFPLGAFLWLAFAPASQAQLNVSVTAFGAQADGILRTDGAIYAGSPVLTSASASFTALDAGKYIQVIGAGPGGSSRGDAIMSPGSAALISPSGSFNSADVGRGIIVLGAGVAGSDLITTIAACTSSSSVTLNAPAGRATSNALYYYGAMTLEGTITSVLSPTSVQLSAAAAATMTSATYSYGTDNHAAFQTAVDAVGQAGGGTVTVPQPVSCPSGAVCGYVATTTDQMTSRAPGSIKIRYNNVSLIGGAPQTNLFCRGAWAAYYNSVKFPGQTGTIRGFCVAIGDDGGPLGVAGEGINNVTVSNLHLYGMTNGNTYSYSYSPTDPPLTTTGDGWDETHKALYIWENVDHSNIVIDTVSIQDFKGENIYSGGGAMTGIVIRNSTMTNFNGDGISMLAADLQVLNNTITNGSNAGIENSSVAGTNAALVRQLYQGNTIGNFPREGLVVVGVDGGIAAGSIQILNNYFDTIAQTNRSGAESAIYLAAQCCGGDMAPSNVTISGNTCHDCLSFGNLQTSGATVVSNNTIVVDQMNGDAFLYFTYPMTNFTISNNTGYRTAAGASAGRGLNSVYGLNPGYQNGNFAWNNVLVENNSWNFPGTPNYTFVTTTGPAWSLVTARNIVWKGETCNGCTYPDINHGVVDLATTTTIEPYGPVVFVNGNSSTATATLDASKELDGAQVRIVNSGTAPVIFNSDRNFTLSSPVTLNPGGGSAVFYFSGATGTYSVNAGSSTVSVAVTPATASMGAGQTAQFSATVNGTSNQQVTWSLSPSGTGSISASGLYSSPASISSQQIVTVTATSVADPTQSASAAITLNPPLTVSVNPPSASLTVNQTQQLTVTIAGSTNQQVTWSLSPSGTGSISASGLYTAPASIPAQETVTVTATSVADSTKSAAAAITLIPPVTVSVNPPSISLTAGQTVQLTATITGSVNQQVTWSVAGAGSISVSGLYTAPSTITAQQTVTVTAASVADASKMASASIILTPVAVSLNLSSAWLGGAQFQQFAATVTGTVNQQVSWSMAPAGAGSLSATGVYTAPALVTTQQTVTVQAASAADPTKTASAIVTLCPVGVAIAPSSTILLATQTAQFTPTVTWTNNPQVSWSISPAGAGGISASGLYTAPATVSAQQTVTVTATSLADVTKAATATITLSSGTGYAYQRTITVAHTQVSATDQTNFPVLVKGVYPFLATAANGGHVQNANGYDIAFSSDSMGLHPLNWEVQCYDPVTGSVVVWVQARTLSHTTDTVLYMNYGNPAIASFQGNTQGTWDGSFAAVYHMSDNAPTTMVADATSNANAAAAQVNTTVASTAGETGSGLRFNGSSDYVNATKCPKLSIVGPITMEGWVNLTSWPRSGYGGVLVARGMQYFIKFTTDNGGAHGIVAGTYNSSNIFSGTAVSIPSALTGAFHHVSATWDGSSWSLYLDGALAAQSASPMGPTLSGEPFTMGGQTFSGGIPFQFLDGALDEVRVSASPRSAGWIATEYHNQSQPSAFYTLGAEQGGSTAPPSISVAVNPPSGSIGAGQTLQLSATVSGSTNQLVTWSLSGAGSVSSSGLYTAPAAVSSQQTVTVTATSAADATKSANAVITVNPAVSVAVTVNPPSGSISAGQTLQLSATVSGSTNQLVTWSLSGAGSVSSSGLYTAPASVSSQQTVTVTATSAADATRSANAVITVNPAVSTAGQYYWDPAHTGGAGGGGGTWYPSSQNWYASNADGASWSPGSPATFTGNPGYALLSSSLYGGISASSLSTNNNYVLLDKDVTSAPPTTTSNIGTVHFGSGLTTIDWAYRHNSDPGVGVTWSTQNVTADQGAAVMFYANNLGLYKLGSQSVFTISSPTGLIGANSGFWLTSANYNTSILPYMVYAKEDTLPFYSFVGYDSDPAHNSLRGLVTANEANNQQDGVLVSGSYTTENVRPDHSSERERYNHHKFPGVRRSRIRQLERRHNRQRVAGHYERRIAFFDLAAELHQSSRVPKRRRRPHFHGERCGLEPDPLLPECASFLQRHRRSDDHRPDYSELELRKRHGQRGSKQRCNDPLGKQFLHWRYNSQRSPGGNRLAV